MNTLACAPLATTADSPAVLDPPAAAFVGRSLEEYSRLFGLDLAAWRGRDVLDVAAGPASFAAEACARRIDAVALDPCYGEPVADLAARIARDAARLAAEVRAGRRLLRSQAIATLAAEAERAAAARRFLQDYELHFPRGRYVAGALPLLPFFDRTFDLVLCGHLLFLRAESFDLDWHLEACRELVRVSAAEVRIHPLAGADGRPYPGLARLRRELRSAGIASESIPVGGESPAGGEATLVLRRAES